MSLDDLKNALPDYAKDTRLNLGKVLSEEGAPGLTQAQIMGTALASAHATREPRTIAAITAEASAVLSPEAMTAARAAASIMAMNNIYYRFVHLAADDEMKKLPANLRMQIMADPGVSKLDFEIFSLAVSAINGCGMCMESHVHGVTKLGLEKQGAQSAIRIAAVINATAQSVVSG